MKATGDTVPTFEGQLVRSDGEKLLAPDPLASVSVSRSQSLALEWVPTPGEVSVRLDASVVLECRFPASAGQGEVPEQLMAELKAGELAHLSVAYEVFTTLAPGGWALRLVDGGKPSGFWEELTVQP